MFTLFLIPAASSTRESNILLGEAPKNTYDGLISFSENCRLSSIYSNAKFSSWAVNEIMFNSVRMDVFTVHYKPHIVILDVDVCG